MITMVSITHYIQGNFHYNYLKAITIQNGSICKVLGSMWYLSRYSITKPDWRCVLLVQLVFSGERRVYACICVFMLQLHKKIECNQLTINPINKYFSEKCVINSNYILQLSLLLYTTFCWIHINFSIDHYECIGL